MKYHRCSFCHHESISVTPGVSYDLCAGCSAWLDRCWVEQFILPLVGIYGWQGLPKALELFHGKAVQWTLPKPYDPS